MGHVDYSAAVCSEVPGRCAVPEQLVVRVCALLEVFRKEFSELTGSSFSLTFSSGRGLVRMYCTKCVCEGVD